MKKATILFLVVIIFFCFLISKNINAESTEEVPVSLSLPENILEQLENLPNFKITEEKGKELEKLLEMPTGKMNDDIWIEIMAQLACFTERKEKVDDATAAEMVKPYGVTFEEWAAYHWQVLTGKQQTQIDFDKLVKEYETRYEELKKNNCRLAGKPQNEEKPSGKMTDEVWLEITARIKCLDRTLLSFTKYEIKTIFDPFGVTPAEYQAYSEDIVKRMEDILKKNDDEWTEEDLALANLNKKLKPRIEELKKKNCVLEDGTPLSEDYNKPIEKPEWWDEKKCKLFSCDNCYKVSEDSSWWEKYRCRSLCQGCPTSPPPPPVEDCSGFCSMENCPTYAKEITGVCAPQEKCRKCGLFKLFKCCQDVPAVCCKMKNLVSSCTEGTCTIDSCPEGTIYSGQADCGSQEKCKCKVKIFGVCFKRKCEQIQSFCCMPQ